MRIYKTGTPKSPKRKIAATATFEIDMNLIGGLCVYETCRLGIERAVVFGPNTLGINQLVVFIRTDPEIAKQIVRHGHLKSVVIKNFSFIIRTYTIRLDNDLLALDITSDIPNYIKDSINKINWSN